MEHQRPLTTESVPPHLEHISDEMRAWYARTYARMLGISPEELSAIQDDRAAAVTFFHAKIQIFARIIPEVGD